MWKMQWMNFKEDLAQLKTELLNYREVRGKYWESNIKKKNEKYKKKKKRNVKDREIIAERM